MPLIWGAGLLGTAITTWLAAPYLESADPRQQTAVQPQDRAMDRARLEGNIALYQVDPGAPPTDPWTTAAYVALGVGVIAFLASQQPKSRKGRR